MEEFTSKVMLVLNDRIIRALQLLPPQVTAVVVGGKCINTLVDKKYQTKTTDWDISVVSNVAKVNNEQARDYVGQTISIAIKDLIRNFGFRLRVIEKYYKVKILDILYEVNPKKFKAFTGDEYTVGHIDVITDKYGAIGVVDLVPINLTKEKGKFIVFDKVNYLGLGPVVQTLITLTKTPGYSKKVKAQARLNKIRSAVTNQGLSCNFYRTYYKQGAKNLSGALIDCVKETALGPADPLVNDRRMFERFNISLNDVRAHDDYYKTLSPKQKEVVYKYTDIYSSIWNAQLNTKTFLKDPAFKVDTDVDILQSIIQNSPPLTQDTIVFMTNRYLFYPNRGYSNYDFKKGQKLSFYTFLSTSYDNQYNPYAFMDLFSPGVAYAITIPKGSRVFIIGRNSKYDNEREVLLPFGCSLKFDKVENHQITYNDGGDIWYDEMTTYFATFSPKVSKKGVAHVDIPTIKNADVYSKLIQNPQFQDLFEKLWIYNKLQ